MGGLELLYIIGCFIIASMAFAAFAMLYLNSNEEEEISDEFQKNWRGK